MGMDMVYGAWRAYVGDPAAFRSSGVHLVVRSDGVDGSVSVVALGDRVLVSLPAGASRGMREAFLELVPQAALTEPKTLTGLLGPLRRALGPAVLSFLVEPADARLPDATGVYVMNGGDRRLDELAARSGEADAAESDIRHWPGAVSAVMDDSAVVAAAGIEVWSPAVAHIGVLVDPAHRGRGLGRRVAGAAVAQALAQGMAVQWRARADLTASRAVARALGFSEHGAQVTVWPR